MNLLHLLTSKLKSKLPGGKLARNASWMLVGQGFKVAIQAAYFTIIARSLGVQNYGAFVGVVGFVGILLPFATMGSGYLLIKHVSRDHHQFRENLGRALLATFSAAALLMGVVALLSRLLLPVHISLKLVLFVAAADLFGTSIVGISGQAFIAFERLEWTASINVFLSAIRLVAAVLLATLHAAPTALEWGELYFASTAVAATLALLWVFLKLGMPTLRLSRLFSELREGLYFSVMQSAQTIYNDIDKAMLARLSTLEAAGIYGAAYRLIDVSFTPVASVLVAAYPNLFRAGVGGVAATLGYVKPLISRAVGYSALLAVGVLVFAGAVPLVLGAEYRQTAEALRWLSVLPLLKAVHFFLSDALTGAGYQALRTAINAGVAAFNVLVNLWVIPLYSWRGAAWSSIASDALLVIATAVAIYVLRGRRQATPDQVAIFEARVEA